MIASILLYLFVAIAGLSAIGILLIRNVMHAALLLIVCLVSVAGIFLMQQAEFLAATQLLIYAGGVLVLIIFGIMLTPRLSLKGGSVFHQNVMGAIFIGLGLLIILGYSLKGFSLETPIVNMKDHTFSVGILLFTNYTAPFELAGILLLVSLISAIVISSQFMNRKS